MNRGQRVTPGRVTEPHARGGTIPDEPDPGGNVGVVPGL